MLWGAINFVTDIDYTNSYSVNGFNMTIKLQTTMLQKLLQWMALKF